MILENMVCERSCFQTEISHTQKDFQSFMSHFCTATFFLILSGLGIGFGFEGTFRWFGLGLLLSAYMVILVLGVSILKLNFFVKAICRGEPSAKRVALTFDDGPDPATTPLLLGVLKRHDIEAAFFPIGRKVEEHPEIIKQIDQEGHIIGNHTLRHAWWTNFMVGSVLRREVGSAQEAIEDAIGKVPAYFRPPMGLTNPHLKKGLKKFGLVVIGWDVRPYDTVFSSDKAAKRVLGKIRGGSIILLHEKGNDSKDFAALIDELVTKIKERKFTFSGLKELTGVRPYQTISKVPREESVTLGKVWNESGPGWGWGRLKRFFIQVLANSDYVKGAIQEQANLDAFKKRPPRRFLIGMGLVLFSYVIGWPMVGLFGFLAAYLKVPVLLMVGAACYGLSHLLWILGMYLAGRESIQYAHKLLRWLLRKVAKGCLNQKESPHEDRSV